MRRHKIVLEPLSKLRKLGVRGNPKKHDKETIRESFNRFGVVVPILVDDGANLIGAGHGRCEVLHEMKTAPRKDEVMPDGVEVRKGEWWVPVIRGVRFKNETELRRYVLMDNKAQENGGWDDGLMPKFIAPFVREKGGLVGTGFADREAAIIMGRAEATVGLDKSALHDQYAIVVDCKGEKDQAQLLRRFTREGLKVRALVS